VYGQGGNITVDTSELKLINEIGVGGIVFPPLGPNAVVDDLGEIGTEDFASYINGDPTGVTITTGSDYYIEYMNGGLRRLYRYDGPVGTYNSSNPTFNANDTFLIYLEENDPGNTDVHEGYTETGTRATGVVVSLGDYDDSNNGTKIVISDVDGKIELKAGGVAVTVPDSDLVVTGELKMDQSGNEAGFADNNVTANRTYQVPDRDGDMSLDYNITTSEEVTNKTFEGSTVYSQRIDGTNEIQTNNLPVSNDPFQNLDINTVVNIPDIDEVVCSTLHLKYRNYEEIITAINLDEYAVSWDGTDWVVEAQFSGGTQVGVINTSDNLVYTDDSYTTLVVDALSNPLPPALLAVDTLIPIHCGITIGTGNVQILNNNNIIDLVEVYEFYIIVEYTKI
jgi:hypothetical protein